MTALAFVLILAGILLVYAGLTGRHVLAILGPVLKGQNPKTATP